MARERLVGQELIAREGRDVDGGGELRGWSGTDKARRCHSKDLLGDLPRCLPLYVQERCQCISFETHAPYLPPLFPVGRRS